jgi:hypothetical protein
MKFLVFLVTFLSYFTLISKAGGLRTETSIVYGNISMVITWEFIDQGKSLPTSWEEISMVREMLENPTSSSNFYRLKIINSMALIPGAPRIRQEKGIPHNYWGCRLFAVSRDKNLDYGIIDPVTGKSAGGRYCAAACDTKEGSMGVWINESEAQLIFKQFSNFDPAKQPIPFEETTTENGKASYKLRVPSSASDSDTITQSTVNQKQERMLQLQKSESSSPQPQEKSWLWLIGLLVLSIVGFSTKYYFSKRSL